MPKILSVGGIFFKSPDPKKLRAWYEKTLLIPTPTAGYDGHGFPVKEYSEKFTEAATIWAPFSEDNDYYKPSTKEFMINFAVDDIKGMVEHIKSCGVEILGEQSDPDFGEFAWLMDPDGTKIELWQPTK